MPSRREDAPAARSTNAQFALADVQDAAELRRRLRRFLAHGDSVVRRSGLTPQRYLLLLAVKGAPDGSESRTIGAIAGDLQLAQSSATELVDRAEAAGLIVRSTAPHDGRVVTISLSDEGQARFAAAFTGLAEDRAELMAYLDHTRTHLAGRGRAVSGRGM
jgi:DNA-binding MarR family transcriptional regulator